MGTRLERDRYAPYFLTVIANVVSSSASQVYLRRYGIGVNDWRVVSHLGLDPGCTAQVVSNVLQVDKSVVSRSVKTLVDRGLVAVESTPGFRRLYLTAEGAALHKEILPVALHRERILLDGLTPEEVDQLLELLRRLQANLPALAAYDPPRAGRAADSSAEDDGALDPPA
ncbi:MAG TPA: MarR family transcriptional regulator [Blastococcus sp.]|nr:MarR family transcriptional regulator [Blastococcus sp.]